MTHLIQWLTRRGYDARAFPTSADAADHLIKTLPKGVSIGIGGSMTIRQMGLADSLRQGGYNVMWHWESQPQEAVRVRDAATRADVYLCSANAVTKDGLLLNTDFIGNRVASSFHGPEEVYFIIGRNKICEDLASAYRRIKEVAAPLNAKRLNAKTPCAASGKCENCLSPEMICRVTALLERPTSGRNMHVLLIDEDLGY